jgi:hypothetical protein
MIVAHASPMLRFCRVFHGALVIAVSLAAACAAWAEDNRKPADSRAMFRELGVDDRYFDRLTDGKPMDATQNETLWRVLSRLRTFPAVDLERWALDLDRLVAAIQQPSDSRGTIFMLRGRVIEVEPITPPKDAVDRYELTRYYRCRLQLDSLGEAADVYTESVPPQWQKGAKPNAYGGAFGVFLKLGAKADDRPVLIFAAPRLAWYSDDLLGQLGMDMGLIDSAQPPKPFSRENPNPADREAFYQMLAAAGRAKPGELLRRAERDLPKTPANWRWTDVKGEVQFSVAPLFNEPATQTGRLVEFLGSARRIEIIRLGKKDQDIIDRFGFDHYYQVYLFTDDSEGYPLTFCILELPEGMPYGNLPHYGETVRVAGFFFKTWSYTVPKMTDPALQAGDPKTRRLLSPLLIGRSLTWYPAASPADNTMSSIVIGVILVLAMAIAWFAAWRSHHREGKWIADLEKKP